ENGLFIQMGAGGDNLILRVDPVDSSKLQVFQNGNSTPLADLPFSSFPAGIRVVGDPGLDLLTLDLSNGNPIPFGGINYDGGSGDDDIIVTGGDAMTYVLSDSWLSISPCGAFLGTLNLTSVDQAVLDGGPSADDFEFNGWTGTAAVNGNGGADSVLVAGTAGDDNVTVTTGGVTLNSSNIFFSGSEAVLSSVAIV